MGVVAMISWMVFACGDGDPHDADGSPGSQADAAVDGSPADADGSTPDGGADDAGLKDAGSKDAGSMDAGLKDAGSFDAAPADAGAGGPTIDSVMTADGFTQVRQGSSAVLVIRGSGLGEITAVIVGELPVTIVSVAPDEVRAELIVPHGTLPGPRDVTVSGPGGSVRRDGAIETTVYVVSGSALPGGRGTFQSPLIVCDAETVTATTGDTISLLAGEHACDAPAPIVLFNGVTIAGAGRGATLVRGVTQSFPGFSFFGDSVGVPTVLRGFTVVAPSPMQSTVFLLEGPATLAIEDLGFEGPGFRLSGSVAATVDGLHVECGGVGVGLETEDSGIVAVTNSSFAGCSTGVALAGGPSSVTSSTFERCSVGIEGFRDRNFQGDLTVTSCELTDNATGIEVLGGVARVSDTLISDVEVTPEAMQTGILVIGASLDLSGGEIVGHDGTGVAIFASVEGPTFAVSITNGLIIGGQIGVHADGRDNPNSLVMRDSVVRDQTFASVLIFVEWFTVTLDLGNGGGPGGNELSVVSGIALRDIREDPDEFNGVIDATGMTLNGRSYAGQLIQGPASVPPDYEMLADGEIQF